MYLMVGVFDNYFEVTADYDLCMILSKYKIGILNENYLNGGSTKSNFSIYIEGLEN